MKSIISFDIFDTLLTRKVASPVSLFLILGDRAAQTGLVSISAEEFQKQRVNAECEARLFAEESEVTFNEIYYQLTNRLNVPISTGNALLGLELAIESELFTPVPGALELVNKARNISNRILFVSDMYLPVFYLRAELINYKLFQLEDGLYVSNDWRMSKASGNLFRKIIATELVHSDKIHHTGDHRQADFKIPSKLGIDARHLDVCRLIRSEKILNDFAVASNGLSSLIAGISRITRLKNLQISAHLVALSQIAASLISPTIVFYSTWILSEAKKRNLKRLYFVARDGCLVKKITDALICAHDLSIETRYLYGSRQAWHLPAITDFSLTSVSWLFEKTRTLNLRIVLARVQIVPEEICQILTDLGLSVDVWDAQLDDVKLAEVKKSLLGSNGFRSRVEKHVVEKRELVLCYLAQEGLFDSVSWALIDLGWHGRLQHSLQTILSFRQPIRPLGLYFGLYADSAVLPELEIKTYLDYDLCLPPDTCEVPSLVFLMESFCTAPHGSTVGYEFCNEKVIPIFRVDGMDSLEKWGFSTVHRVVDRFAIELGRLSLSEPVRNWDSRPAVCKMLRTFSTDPLPDEASSWGSFPYEDEQAGEVKERLTKKLELSLTNLRAAVTYGDHRLLPTSWQVLWQGGQLHVCSVNSRLIKVALQFGVAKRRLGKLMRSVLKYFRKEAYSVFSDK